jgi:hypothetical protein
MGADQGQRRVDRKMQDHRMRHTYYLSDEREALYEQRQPQQVIEPSLSVRNYN